MIIDKADEVHRLACLELRGGNHSAAYAAELPGLAGWVSCRPLRPSPRGGDLYYLSACSQGVIARDYVVLGKLYEFGEVDSASVRTRISLQVELVDTKTNRNIWDHLVEHEEPVGSKSVLDVVQSLDRNLQQVVSETATQIDKFLPTRE